MSRIEKAMERAAQLRQGTVAQLEVAARPVQQSTIVHTAPSAAEVKNRVIV